VAVTDELITYRKLANIADAYARLADPDGHPNQTSGRDFMLPPQYWDALAPIVKANIRGTIFDNERAGVDRPHFRWRGVACIRGDE
jgi:hypothetical protein